MLTVEFMFSQVSSSALTYFNTDKIFFILQIKQIVLS